MCATLTRISRKCIIFAYNKNLIYGINKTTKDTTINPEGFE